MKKITLALEMMLIILMPTSTAYAGSINSYENEVIAAAKQKYEYKGISYQVEPSYIKQLEDYLSSDEVELNAEQRDEVLDMAFSNIEKGVTDGYLVPVKEQDSDQNAADQEDNSSGDTTTNNSSSEDISGASDNASEVTDSIPSSDNTSNTGSNHTEASDSDIDTVTNGNTNDNTVGQPNSSDVKDNVSPVEMLDNIVNSDTTGNSSDSLVNTESNSDNIIKNTGFNLSNTVITIAGMGFIMLVAIYVTIRSNYFAPKDE